jgi:hypothetical protein
VAQSQRSSEASRDREAQHLPTENLAAGYVRIRPGRLGTAMTYRVMYSTYGNGELPSATLEFHERPQPRELS